MPEKLGETFHQLVTFEDSIARSYLEGGQLNEILMQIDTADASAVKKEVYRRCGEMGLGASLQNLS